VPDPPAFEPRSPFETAFRTAIEGADAYRAVRAGLRLHDEILRVGNRFVSIDRFREIAYIALGNASASMAFAAQEMLGERLTQGLSAGAVAPPEMLQFQHIQVPDPWPGSPPAESARASAIELAGGLRSGDLLLVLLSPGAFSITAGPPAGWEPSEWRRLLQGITEGYRPVDAVRVARLLGTGVVGGRLGAAVPEATVATLVVDRGEGAEWIGGGPTIPPGPEEFRSVQRLLAESPAAAALHPLDLSVGPNVQRPVVVTGPADALEAAGNLLAGQGWISRLVSLHLAGSPEQVATDFVQGMERLRREQTAPPVGSAADPEESEVRSPAFMLGATTMTPAVRPKSRGLAVFAGVSFGAVEGGERSGELTAFLRAAASQTMRRETYIGALRTAGGIPGRGEGAGLWMGRRSGTDPSTEPAIELFRIGGGFTDVGTILVGFVPWGAR
jgi:glycerate-2-kinase